MYIDKPIRSGRLFLYDHFDLTYKHLYDRHPKLNHGVARV